MLTPRSVLYPVMNRDIVFWLRIELTREMLPIKQAYRLPYAKRRRLPGKSAKCSGRR